MPNKQNRLILKYSLRHFFHKFFKLIWTGVFLILIYIFFYRKEIIEKQIEKIDSNLIKLSDSINKNICNKLNIEGVKYADYNRIENSVQNYCSNSSFTILKLENEIIQDPWIQEVHIHKKLPNSLTINIVEHIPFALLKNNSLRFKLIDNLGNIINIPDDKIYAFNYLLKIIFNNFDKNEINNLFNILSVYNNLAKKIKIIERIGNRRWNLILDNNILIKMPEEDEKILESWNVLNNIMEIYGLEIGLKEIDLRINGKIFLKYKDDIAKEIKNI